MKRLLSFICLLTCLNCLAQNIEDTNRYFKNPTIYGQNYTRGWFSKILRVPDTINADKPSKPGAIASNSVDKLFVWDGTKWNPTTSTTTIIVNDSSGNTINVGRDTLPGGAFTSVPQVGFNPGTNLTPAEIVTAAFYSSQPPIAGLTGGQTMELMGAGADLSFTLNWIAGRNFATQPLESVTVGGVSESFSQPTLNASTSGTQTVTIPRNTNSSFVNEVTTTDAKTATATTSFIFQAKRYAGWNATNTPTDANILAGNISEFSTSNAKTWTQPAPTSSSYFFYAYPSSFGDLQHFIINGFESLNSFTLTKRNVQNASGYVQQYNIYVSNNLLAYGLTNQAY